MIKKLYLAVFLFILINTLTIFAAEDFTLTTAVDSSTLCPSATGLFTFQVKNAGTTESKYTVNLAGSASNFATIVPTGFSLIPDKTKTVYIYATPKSTSKQGAYDLKISVSTDSLAKSLQ